MSTQSLDSDIYDYGFILNSTALHEAAMSVLLTTIYGRWRGTTTATCVLNREHVITNYTCCMKNYVTENSNLLSAHKSHYATGHWTSQL